MAISIAEMVARAEAIALAQQSDPALNPVADMGMTAEAILPHAIRYAIGRDIESGGDTTNYVRHIPVIIGTDGTGSMPNEVLREYFCSSYLISPVRVSSYVPYSDFIRRRFTSALRYYSYSAGTFYVGEASSLFLIKQSTSDASVSVGSQVVNISPDTVNPTVAAGDRITIQAPGVDGFIESASTSFIQMQGRAVASVAATTAVIKEGKYYIEIKTISPISVTNGSDIVSFPSGEITSADIGKRLSVKTSAGVTVCDAIILATPSATTAQLGLASLITTSTAIGKLMDVGVNLAAVAMPKIDSSSQLLDISSKIAEDAIAVTAAVLMGQMPVAQLIVTH